MIKFIVPGDPKAQGRPRFARMGKFVKTYDPKDSADYKNKVALFAKQAGVQIVPGDVRMNVDCYVKRPKSLNRKKDSPERMACFKRPDLDNMLKSLMDGLLGIAYLDDGQVQSVKIEKWYHEIGGAPRMEVMIY